MRAKNNEYYTSHSTAVIDDTMNVDMTKQYDFFEKYVKKNGTILDIGFGSGRDSLYFQKNGYTVYAIDPTMDFCIRGKELGIEHVECMYVEDMKYEDLFDGIWACASLLHVESKNLVSVFNKCAIALRENGCMYASFKYGEYEGERNGRFFTDRTLETIKPIIEQAGMHIVESSLSEDVRVDRSETWLNLIIAK